VSAGSRASTAAAKYFMAIRWTRKVYKKGDDGMLDKVVDAFLAYYFSRLIYSTVGTGRQAAGQSFRIDTMTIPYSIRCLVFVQKSQLNKRSSHLVLGIAGHALHILPHAVPPSTRIWRSLQPPCYPCGAYFEV
jgi:hypothetical protein